MRTTSPRFAWYADNWHVLEKIGRFVEAGDFNEATRNCPAFGADELRAALDYLDSTGALTRPDAPAFNQQRIEPVNTCRLRTK